MKMLDLFSGIGGFSLAAQWVWGEELEIVGFCEIEKYCQEVLKKNFPGVPIYDDITKLNGKDFKNIDLITGGFPCQDISVAGKGAGIEGSRSSLWFEMHRIIGEVRPSFALIENVPMLVIRGGTRVIADLAEIGYDSSWTIIGADDVGAWHRRKRIWIVAYPRYLCGRNDEPRNVGLCGGKQFDTTIGTASQFEIARSSEESEVVPDTNNDGRNRSGCEEIRSKDDERKENKSIRRTSADNTEPQDSDGRVGEKPRIGRGAIAGRDDEKNKTAATEGVCRLSEKSDKPKRIIRKDRDKKDDSGTLVQVRSSGIQPPFSGGLGENNTTFERSPIQRGNDALGVNRMDGEADISNTKSRESRKQETRNRREGSGRGSKETRNDEKDRKESRDKLTSRCNRKGESWDFEPKLGLLADGLSSGLAGYWDREPEGIPRVSKGVKNRVAKLKGLGNAIVPQVAKVIMEMIKSD